MRFAAARNRRFALLAAALGWSLAALAIAAPNAPASFGRGLYGSVNDRVVTYTGFSLIIFFPTFVFVMSRLQYKLELRRERRAEAYRQLERSSNRPGGGW